MNPGFMPAIMRAISGRMPLGRSWNVFTGNRETKSTHTFPADPKESAKRALGSVPVAVRIASYFRHDAEGVFANTWDTRSLQFLLSIVAVTRPLKLRSERM